MTIAHDSEVRRERSQGRRRRVAARTRAPKKEDHLAEQLAGYAFAAGAALVASPASAEIIYSGVQNITIGNNASHSIDLNSDGTNDYTFELISSFTESAQWKRRFNVKQAGTALNAVVALPSLLPVNMAEDAIIGVSLAQGAWSFGATKDFALGWLTSGNNGLYNNFGNFAARVTTRTSSGLVYGFLTGSPGYLGARFETTGGTRYGWIEAQVVRISNTTNSAKITGWAYDTTGGSILAGQTVAVPEPSGLAALAAGAAGLVAWRRLKQKKSVAAEGTQEG